MTATRPTARSVDQGNAGRRSRGTPQTELNAFCTAMATPRAPEQRADQADHQREAGAVQGVHAVLKLRADLRVRAAARS